MIEIKNIIPVKNEIIETTTHTYRRNSADSWEILLGDSWETEYSCESLEKAYQYFIGNK